jgi:hypothetical protein
MSNKNSKPNRDRAIDDKGAFFAMILVGKQRNYSQHDIEILFNKEWPDLPNIKNFNEKDGTSVFDMDQYHIKIIHVPSAIPQEALEYPIKTAYYWKGARTIMTGHKSHYVVAVSSKKASVIEKYLILTKIVFSLGQYFDTVGIYWNPSYQIFKPQHYFSFSSLIHENKFPVPIWIKVVADKNDDGSYNLYTEGMENFNQREMEIINYKGSFSEGLFSLLDLADYLLINGPIVKDGDTVGSRQEPIKTKFTKSRVNPKQEVMRLIP